MTELTIRNASPPPLAVTRRPRNPQDVRQIQWHATRGAAAMDRQVAATENWFANPANDLGGWGGSADFVVGSDYRVGGEVVIVAFGDVIRTYSTWSAGYGNAGTLPAAQYGIAIEVAQPAGKDRFGNYVNDPNAAFESYTPETVDACIFLVRHINKALEEAGLEPIPHEYIGDWDQLASKPVPRGHIGHDTLANGRKLGKSDPGYLFPLGTILDALKAPPPQPVDLFKEGRRSMRDEVIRLVQGINA